MTKYFYPETAISETAMSEPLFYSAARKALGFGTTINKQSPDDIRAIYAFAAATLHPELEPILINRITPGGHAQGRSVAGGPEEIEEAVDETPKFFLRPNGQKYFHRPWGAKLNDVQVCRLSRENDMYIMLYGPPGTGKTALGEASYDDMVTVLGTGDTEVSDLVGGYVQDDTGAFVWIDGPMLVAMEEGRALLIDEIGIIDPKVLTVLYGAMDGRREYTVTANPARGTVKAKKGFFVIAATNPNAPGVRLSEALVSRFPIQVEVTTDYPLALSLGVDRRIVATASNMDGRMRRDDGLEWAPQFRELLAFKSAADVFGMDFAISNMIAAAPPSVRDEFSQILAKNLGKTYLPAQIK